ncbi:hypothetical protein [Spirosoma rigui]|uniref:hypothetical protein n=1 Tax=Spirosoma rigui TaxID=564064 RepID=UPI0009B14FEF|nr:hypothetical protein [Spirosoma rigui]
MKTIKLMPLLTAGLLVVLLASCGPSYVGVRTAPNYGYGYGYGPGYYGARPYYNYGYRPGYGRPPVIVQRRTYVVPQTRYRSNPSYSPNARSGRYDNGGYRSNGPGNGRSRGPR